MTNLVFAYIRTGKLKDKFLALAILFSLVGAAAQSALALKNAETSVATFQQGASGYAGAVDTFLRGTTAGNTNFNNNTNLEWDDNSGTTTDEIALVRFTNLFTSEGGPIPNGATITSASLTYWTTSSSSAPGNPANVYESLVNWTGSSVTYNNFGGEAGIQTDEYSPALIASAPATALSTQYTINVTASVQRWSNGTPNYGWIFLPTASDGVNLYSSDFATVANRPLLSVTFTTDPVNQPPAPPTPVQPADGATDTSTSPTLEVTVSDPDSDPLDVAFYGRRINNLPPGPDFTVIAMPDTQHYTDGVGDAANFAAQTQWIVDNRELRNIVFVTGLGDIVENGNASDAEWQIAHNAYSLIEDPLTTLLADGIPFGLAVGNHDQSPIGGGSGASTTKYNQYFGVSRFSGRGYYGGHHGSDNDNNYELFSAGGMDFIVIHFEYDTTPEQAVLDWADALLTTHSDRRAILTTHYMINQGNPGSWGAQGQALYNALSDHPNLFLMLGGHIHGEGRRQDTAVNGNVVTTLLSDYQDLPNGGNGFLRIMQFSPANDAITVYTYSPVLDQYGTDPVMGSDTTSAVFTVLYNMDNSEPFVQLGAVNDVTGGNASMVWAGLEPNADYEWYATVSDGSLTTTGNTWSFSSGVSSPTETPIGTATSTSTSTPTATYTASPTTTRTPTPTIPAAATSTPSTTPTRTATPTATQTPSLTPTSAASLITLGETSVLTTSYSGNGNLLIAQQVTLSQSATIQSLSYYVSTAGGQLRLGIYNNNGSNPGTLMAETAPFTPVVGWNTQPVINPTLLPAGTYWLAFLPQNNTLAGRVIASGTGRYYTYTFGAMPSTYSSSPTSAAFRFSFYATLSTGSNPTGSPTASPSPSHTPTLTASPSAGNTSTPTLTRTPTPTPTRTATPVNTPTVTRTPTRTPTSSGTITLGETGILSTSYSGLGNRLVAQQVTLSQSATIQSLSYYVSTASGQLRLGIYNNNGSNPGTLVAETAPFTTVTGWNTQPVTTPTLLSAGTYWLAFLPQDNTLAGRVTVSGTGRHYTFTFGPLPAAFSTSPTSDTFHFSLYATLTIGP